MYWLMRQAGIGRLGSVVGGVLFSVVPGHQEVRPPLAQLLLGRPPGVWLVLQAAHDRPILWRPRDDGSWRSLIRPTLIVLTVGLSGVLHRPHPDSAGGGPARPLVPGRQPPRHRRRRGGRGRHRSAGGGSLKRARWAMTKTLSLAQRPRSVPGESERSRGSSWTWCSLARTDPSRSSILTLAYNAGTTATVEKPAHGARGTRRGRGPSCGWH